MTTIHRYTLVQKSPRTEIETIESDFPLNRPDLQFNIAMPVHAKARHKVVESSYTLSPEEYKQWTSTTATNSVRKLRRGSE